MAQEPDLKYRRLRNPQDEYHPQSRIPVPSISVPGTRAERRMPEKQINVPKFKPIEFRLKREYNHLPADIRANSLLSELINTYSLYVLEEFANHPGLAQELRKCLDDLKQDSETSVKHYMATTSKAQSELENSRKTEDASNTQTERNFLLNQMNINRQFRKNQLLKLRKQ